MQNRITFLVKTFGAASSVLLVAFCAACSSDTSEYHPDDKELAPVDWAKWNQPKLYPYIRNGSLDEIESAIIENPSIVLEKSPNGSGSSLFEAVRHGRYDVVSLLIENGADANEQLEFIDYNSPNIPKLDMRGYSALHLAVENGDAKMVELLISLGASVDSSYKGRDVLQFAKEEAGESINEILSRVR